MSDFKTKMHQIRFRPGFRSRPRWGSLQRCPDPLAGFERRTSKGGQEGKGEGVRGREGGEGRGEEAFLVMCPRRLSALNPPLVSI